MKNSQVYKFVLLLLASIFLFSCTMFRNFYFRNLTNKEVKVVLIPMKGSNVLEAVEFEFPYVEKIIKIRFRSFEKFKKTINVKTKSNKENITFLIPPKSTVFVGFGSPVKFPYFHKAIFYDEATIIDTLDFTKSYEMWLYKLQIKGKRIWYDIKEK